MMDVLMDVRTCVGGGLCSLCLHVSPCVSRTFTHNMLAFGLSKKLCRDFLKKQAVIGSLNEGKASVG